MSAIVSDAGGAVVFSVKVVTRANKNEIVGLEADTIKVRLSAPPVEGRANEALIRFLADEFNVARTSVEIVSGQTSHRKRVRVRGIRPDRVERILQRG